MRPPRPVLIFKKYTAGLAMERREFIALLGSAAAAMPSPAHAQPPQSAQLGAELLAGSWGFVSSVDVRADGSSFRRWDADAKGILMIDGRGRFSQIIVGSESRIFGAKSFCSFGAYSFDEAKKVLTTRIEASPISKLVGIEQRRVVVSLTTDELKYVNHHTASGTKAEVVWKRLG